IAALSNSFPDSPALLSAKARKAGYLIRSGDPAGGRALFDEVVGSGTGMADSATALRNLLGPFFHLLPTGRNAGRRSRHVPGRPVAATARRRATPGNPRPPIFGRQ